MSFVPVDPAAEPPHIIYQPLPPSAQLPRTTTSRGATTTTTTVTTATTVGGSAARGHHRLVLFIPGNPGCISYYGAYLAHLAQRLLADGEPAASITVVGISLGNFSSPRDDPEPFGLRAQIEFVERARAKWVQWVADAASAVDALNESSRAPTGEPPSNAVHVTLVGHSVGAYIGMEVLSRWKRSIDSSAGVKGTDGASHAHIDPHRITGFVGLWPTITHIAQSPSGLRLANILRFRHLALLISGLVRLLVALLPRFIMLALVGRVTRFPQSAKETTAAFLYRPYSVRQALHMARDEMIEITDDRWTDDIWHAGKDGPQLSFLFGDEDHWVSNDARELLIRSHQSSKQRPGAIMKIDGTDIPHSFCIRDSAAVAERTAHMISEMLHGETHSGSHS